MKGINLQIIEFKQELLNVITKSHLPCTVVQMALRETLGEVDSIVGQEVLKEEMKYKESQSTEKEEKVDGAE